MRLAVVYITPELLGAFCRNGERHFRVEDGAPEGATFVNATFDYEKRAFRIYFESAEFPQPAEGEDLTFTPTITAIEESGGH